MASEKVEHKLVYALKSWNSLRIIFEQLERLEVLALVSGPGRTGAGSSLVGSGLWSFAFGQKPCVASAQALPVRQCVGSCDYDLMTVDHPPKILSNLQMTSLLQNIANNLFCTYYVLFKGINVSYNSSVY